jgi:hypothetical protein
MKADMPRVRRNVVEKGIGDIIQELGISEDLSPEDAAKEQTRIFESSVLVTKAGNGALLSGPLPDAEDDDDDDEDDDEPDSAAATPTVRPRASAAVAAAVEEEEETEEEPDPLPFIAPPPPASVKPKVKAKSPSTTKLGKGLADKLPGAERIKVYKRLETGSLGHIGDYRARDLNDCTDIEEFIARYVKPTYGAGEYVLKGVDAYGREIDVGSVHLLGQPQMTEGNNAIGLLQNLFHKQFEMLNDERERARQAPPQPVQDPITMLRNVMAISETVTEKARKEKEGLAAEASNASNGMMQMFMMMMQQQQQQAQQQAQQMQQMLMTLMAPKEDPLTKVLLSKLLEEKSNGHSAPLPPPPPPPPAPDPMEGIAKLITALAEAGLVGGGGGGGGGDAEVKNLLKEMVLARENDRVGPKDLINILQASKEERGTDDFKRSADNLSMMLQLTNQMRQSTEGGAAAGFFDALAALFGNRDFAGSIAGAIRSKASDTQQTQALQLQQQTILQQRALAQAAQQRARIQAEARGALQAAPVAQPIAPAAQPFAPGGNTVMSAGHSVPPTAVSVAPSVETPAAPPRLPPLPANTSEHINKIVTATDEAGLMEASIKLLMYLSEFPEWSAFTTKLLGAAQNGNKREMLQYLSILFEGFIGMGLLEEPVAKRVLLTTMKHFDVIHKQLGNDGAGDSILPPDEGEEAGDDEEEDEGEGDFDFLSEGGSFDTLQP